MGGRHSRRSIPGERSGLRLDDLRTEGQASAKLMNVKITETTASRIDRVVADTGWTKTAVVIALLNEGLEIWADVRRGWTPPSAPTRKRRGRPTGRAQPAH